MQQFLFKIHANNKNKHLLIINLQLNVKYRNVYNFPSSNSTKSLKMPPHTQNNSPFKSLRAKRSILEGLPPNKR